MRIAEGHLARRGPRSGPGRQQPTAGPQHQHAVASFKRGIAGQQLVGLVGGIGFAQRLVGEHDRQATDLDRVWGCRCRHPERLEGWASLEA